MSSGSTMYRQVRMIRRTGTRVSYDTAWIPTDFAKVGKILRVKVDEMWQDGWEVSEVHNAKSLNELQIERQAQKRWKDVLTPSEGGDE